MATTTAKTGEQFKCPHCNQEQEEPVENYVIGRLAGAKSLYTTECDFCYKDFKVMRTEEDHNTFVIDKE